MIRLRHRQSRELFKRRRGEIVLGLRSLGEVLLIEAALTIGWGGLGRRIAQSRIRPRLDDAVEWVNQLGDEPE